MADISLTVRGLDGLLGGLAATGQRVSRDAADIVQRGGSRYQSRAKYHAPVLTGRLRGDIRIQSGGELTVTVTSHAPYSGFQEFGTSRCSPQPYMGPAEKATTPEIVNEFVALGRTVL